LINRPPVFTNRCCKLVSEQVATGDGKDAMKKMISRKRPEGGWPKPEKKKRG